MTETREPAGPDAAVEQTTEEKPSVRLDWSDADNVPVQQANVVQVQFMGTEMLLTLGMALPPIAMAGMTPEQTDKYLREHSIPIRQITKVLLSQEAMKVLAGYLQPASSSVPAEGTRS